MRTATFIGLTEIAKCINNNLVSEDGGFLIVICFISILLDGIDLYKKLNN